MIRLAANLSTLFTEVPLPERFALAAEAGFRFVEIQSVEALEPQQLAALLRGAGLSLVLFNAPAGKTRGLAGGDAQAFADSIEQVLGYIDATGCPRVHVQCGVRESGSEAEAADNRLLVSNLQHAADRLATRKASVMLEALNGFDAPGYRLGTLAAAAALQDRLGRDNVRLQFDTYHAQRSGFDPRVEFPRYVSRVGHVQMAGVPDRGEPDRDGVPAATLMAMMAAAGYDGFVGCEYRPRGRTQDGLGWAAPWLS